MVWPSSTVSTANMDAGTDSPATARSQLLQAVQRLNEIIGHAGTLGRSLLAAVTAADARTTLGASTVGASVFTASNAAAARTALGLSTVGNAVATAADAAAARTAIGAAAASDLASAVPVGAFMGFMSEAAPAGFLKCNGALVSRSTYAALFAVLGTRFGAGDGSTTFALPDLRGEFLRGWDDGRGVDAGRALGSAQAQSGRGITSNSGAQNVLGTTNIYAVWTTANHYSQADWSEVQIRPRNVSALWCIKF